MQTPEELHVIICRNERHAQCDIPKESGRWNITITKRSVFCHRKLKIVFLKSSSAFPQPERLCSYWGTSRKWSWTVHQSISPSSVEDRVAASLLPLKTLKTGKASNILGKRERCSQLTAPADKTAVTKIHLFSTNNKIERKKKADFLFILWHHLVSIYSEVGTCPKGLALLLSIAW